MKLTIMNYDIDTDIEKNYQELSDKLGSGAEVRG